VTQSAPRSYSTKFKLWNPIPPDSRATLRVNSWRSDPNGDHCDGYAASYSAFYEDIDRCLDHDDYETYLAPLPGDGCDGKYGQSDLAGNLMEWNSDRDDGEYPNPCNDCSQLVPATYRMTPGGSFNYDATQLLSSSVSAALPPNASST
jgi:formylglycine-generating enzyme required for sulfatase activity